MNDHLQDILGEPVADPEEESFLVFSQALPSQSLGFVDSKASVLDIAVAGRDLAIRQSRGLLHSDRKQGTTGAVVWRVTPLFAEWIASPNFLFQSGYLTPASTALELGAGVSGIVALTLGPKIRKYIATDQDYVIRLLKQNISENLPAPVNKKTDPKHKRSQKTNEQPSTSIEVLELDWELDSISSLPSTLSQNPADGTDGLDMLIACDCIYNEALIEPLNSTCAELCRLQTRHQHKKPTLCLIAQQLRSPDVFESWLKSFQEYFRVWRVPDHLLAEGLKEHSGFVVHVGILR